MKKFNTTGTCIPDKHYMVDITDRLNTIKGMIDEGDYFCINRGRQYGKTTTLNALAKFLSKEYSVFQISFEGLDESVFSTQESLMMAVLRLMHSRVRWGKVNCLTESAKSVLEDALSRQTLNSIDFVEIIVNICHQSTSGVVLLIDEVDQAGNYESFVKFLGLLRNMYLDRDNFPTFQSVILAGVYDVRNLKLKVREDSDHQYNSPWNIAVPFDTDMSLSKDGIVGMLQEYKNDKGVKFDESNVAQMISDYTSGYPFLVSRVCQIIDQNSLSWDKSGVLKAVNVLLKEGNTLFDDITKKLNQYPELSKMLQSILYSGQRIPYNFYDKNINMASMFSFVKDNDGAVAITCRIFETWLYNYFYSFESKEIISQIGGGYKDQFIHDGKIDMRRLMERFVVHFNEIYHPEKDQKFLEDNCRKIFLTYLRPIINGVGNYYCEARTRDLTRTDVIIDYLGEQYIIEMKIWHGNSYNERGEKQLAEYLELYQLSTGYMLSFCFNKNKQSGLLPAKVINGRTLIEAIV